MPSKLSWAAWRHKNILIVLAVVLGAAAVYGAAAYAPTALLPEVQDLAQVEWSFEEYADYFRRLSDDRGAPYAFRVLLQAPMREGTDLHLLAHVVGDKLYEQQGMKGMYECTQDFRNACSHSVVIGILNEFGEGALGDIADMCRKAPGGTGAYTMCFHGLGHGVLAFNEYKLDRAVAMCAKTGTLAYGNREYIECVGGATMEMVAGVHDRAVWQQEVRNYFKESDPLYPCNASFMPSEVQPACYMHLTPRLLARAGMDLANPDPATFPEAFSYCDAIPEYEEENRNTCYGGFGKEFIGIVQGRDIRNVGATSEPELQRMHEWCDMAGLPYTVRACNTHVLASLYWGGENSIDASLAFCALAEGETRASCYQELVGQVRYYFPSSSERFARCGALPAAYQGVCRAL